MPVHLGILGDTIGCLLDWWSLHFQLVAIEATHGRGHMQDLFACIHWAVQNYLMAMIDARHCIVPILHSPRAIKSNILTTFLRYVL